MRVGWLAAVLDACPVAMIGQDLHGAIVAWNPPAERLYGYHAEEVLGRSVSMLSAGPGANDPQDILRLLRQGEEVRSVLVERRHRDGHVIPLWLSGSPVYDAGAVVGGVVVARSASSAAAGIEAPGASPWSGEQAQDDGDLEAFRLAFAGSPLPMWIYNVDTLRIVAVNDAAVAEYRLPRNQFLDLLVTDLHLPDTACSLRAQVNGNENRVTVGHRATHVRADGTVMEVSVSAQPVYLRNGRGRLVVARDLTEHLAALDRADTAQQALERTLTATITAIAATSETRDPYTAGHQNRVAQLAAAMATRLGLPENKVRGVHLAATIHDIGKISLPAEILMYPGKLSTLAFELVKTHSRAGYDIVAGIDFPWPIAETILQHHERLDGSGYPSGLGRGEIITEALIVAVADVTEAITAHRPYRPAQGLDVAFAELRAGRGRRYDADCVDACIDLLVGGGFAFTAIDQWAPDRSGRASEPAF